MEKNKPRVVFDCNILWRAFFFETGIGSACVRLIFERSIDHFVSADTIEELLDVLTRNEMSAKFPSYSIADVTGFVGKIVGASTLAKNVPAVTTLVRDPDDEPYLNLAASITADFLVTLDRDLLDLMTGTDVESKQFRQRFRHLKIVKPDEFLQIIIDRELPLKP